MPRPVTVTVSHDLGKIEARRRINEGFEKFRSSLTGGMMFNFAEEWTGEDQLSFTARGLGQTIFGTIDIFPQHIRIEATLPNLLAGIAEAITGKMEHEGKLLLEKK
ncbi:MAG TPA: polyhydroxyalkanoic acid system family protein [Parvularculaceae bacterium]|nr:polyhydroxyalkanoic acid system family protein [Parvularculaceae bacterium]